MPDKLDYAQRFIHLWMSGQVPILRKPQPWLTHGSTLRERFLEFLGLVKKWSLDKSAESLCFFDYLDSTLE